MKREPTMRARSVAATALDAAARAPNVHGSALDAAAHLATVV